jgi:hypothetical protein
MNLKSVELIEVKTGVILGLVGVLATGCSSAPTLQGSRCGPTPRLLVSAASYAPDAGGAGQNYVVGMAVDGSDLYFTVVVTSTTGALMHVSTSGGTATQLANGYQFQTPVVTPTGIIVGYVDQSTYTGGILSVPRSGGSATSLVDLGDDELVAPPVTDGTSVYFVTATGAIDTVPLTPGASPAVPTQLGSGNGVGGSLGVFGQLLLLNSGEINEIPIGASDAGGETTLLSGGSVIAPLSLSACGADACWLTGANVAAAAVEQLDPAAGTVSAVASLPDPVAGPTYLLFDGTSFFVVGSTWVIPPSGSIWTIERIPQQGGTAVAVATVPQSSILTGFAVDDACVYFSTPGGIYSLASSAEGVTVQ